MTVTRCPSPAKAACDFNLRFPVGSEVMLKKDGVPDPVLTRTESEAFVTCNHSTVVFLEGISGCYLITHVSEVKP